MPVQKPNIVRVQIPAASYGRGRAYKISQISEHHAVGNAEHVINKAKTQTFSCTFTIGTDGTIYQLVEIGDTAYCDNDYRSNGRAINIEHAGGGNFPYTEAMYQSSIKLHAWLFQELGELNCIRHRDIPEIKADPRKATACSGDLDVDRIVREAKQLLKTGAKRVIENNDYWRDFLRIIHSEIGGWDLHRTHAGEFDKLFMDAWYGKTPDEAVWGQWNNGGGYRAAKEQQKQAVADLTNSLNGSKAELDAARSNLATCDIRVAEESKKATAAGIKITELEAAKTATTKAPTKPPKDPNAPNPFWQILARLLAGRFTKKK